MDNGVGFGTVFPEGQEKHLDVIRSNIEGEVVLATSNRSSRYWFGSIWFCTDANNIQCTEKCESAVSLQTGINDVQWISDKIIVAGLDSGTVACWEVNTDEQPFLPLWNASEHDNLVSSISVYQVGDVVVSGSYDGKVKVWKVEDDCCSCTHTYRGHSDLVWSVDHHIMQPLFISCSKDGTVILWDTRTSKPASRYTHFSPLGPVCARWQPTTESVVAVGAANGAIHMTDLRQADAPVRQIKPHTRPVRVMEFSTRSSRLLATAGEDCAVKVLDLGKDDSEATVYEDRRHGDHVRSLAWRSETELLSCSWDGSVLAHVGAWNNRMDVNGVGAGDGC